MTRPAGDTSKSDHFLLTGTQSLSARFSVFHCVKPAPQMTVTTIVAIIVRRGYVPTNLPILLNWVEMKASMVFPNFSMTPMMMIGT